jgi:DNA-binding transcriptional regulator YhcF (GntR family)
MQQVTASMPGDQDIGSHGSGDGWLTALAVHRGSFVPLHRQIHDLVRQEIVDGRLAPGSRLPSEGALAEQWGISLAPVRQALMHLAAEGYLDRRRGRGTFVRQPKFDEKILNLSSFTGSHAEHGDRLELVMLYKGLVSRRPEAAALGGRSRKLVLIQRLAHLEASPVALLSAYLDPASARRASSRWFTPLMKRLRLWGWRPVPWSCGWTQSPTTVRTKPSSSRRSCTAWSGSASASRATASTTGS